MPIDRLKLVIYVIAFSLSFALYAGIHLHLGVEALALVWMVIALSTAGFAWLELRSYSWHRAAMRIGVIAATIVAIVHPVFLAAMQADMKVLTTVRATELWPQLLVTLFASRVLATESAMRTADAWRVAAASKRFTGIQTQSIPAAFCFGGFLTIACYVFVAQLAGPNPGQIGHAFISAIFGNSFIHHAIIFLFFVVVAYIAESFIRYFGDLHALQRLSIRSEQHDSLIYGPRDIMKRARDENPGLADNTRMLLMVEDAVVQAMPRTEDRTEATRSRLDIYTGLDRASRAFVRTMITFLPLLGFLGTVLGITQALSGLPLTFGDAVAEAPEFSRGIAQSLSGIAVAFETTLLGLIANILASLAMAYLEKRENELASECHLVVRNALDPADAGTVDAL